MAKVGRKSVYDLKIKPRFNDITKWIKNGASEKQVAAALGIAESSWFKYKAENKEFSEFLKNIDRTEVILELRSALIKKALGFKYEESKKYKKTDEDGKTYTQVEISEKYSPPDVAAINLALKNYDSENWSNDPAMLQIKKDELQLKKIQAEKENW